MVDAVSRQSDDSQPISGDGPAVIRGRGAEERLAITTLGVGGAILHPARVLSTCTIRGRSLTTIFAIYDPPSLRYRELGVTVGDPDPSLRG